MEKIFSLPDRKRLKAVILYGSLATAFFAVIYGLCNQLAVSSQYHYKLYTNWELSIPLIPWMIYPYLSLNLIFILSVFVVKEISAIKAYCFALIYGVLAAGIVFYFFPGELGFQRQIVTGYEEIFSLMFRIDHPHNLYPSLHITYSSVGLWAMIEQTKNKFFNLLLYLWQLLIAASVIFVHQHHLFDIISGLILAYVVFKLAYFRYHYK